ncbi:MAG TPA: DUF1080 domain-containing protein [Gemmatimonadales bacterium]|nr:DUF1080 domain-containing protein [Gemmatimonadales bacterium]
MSRHTLAASAAILLAACATNRATSPADTQHATLNTLSPQERRDGFTPLFNGTDLTGWRAFHRQDVSIWQVRDGMIYQPGGDGADLMTVDEYKDFELRLEWRIAPGGNSGIFYRATEEYPEIYWSAPEMQVLDDARHPDGHNRLTSAGSAYGLYAAPAGVVKPAMEWNAVRIIVRGHHVEHWLNGQKVVEYDLGSPDWTAKVAASKFHEWPHYGLAPQGHIGLQVHGNEVWYRNVRIKKF